MGQQSLPAWPQWRRQRPAQTAALGRTSRRKSLGLWGCLGWTEELGEATLRRHNGVGVPSGSQLVTREAEVGEGWMGMFLSHSQSQKRTPARYSHGKGGDLAAKLGRARGEVPWGRGGGRGAWA